MISLDSSVSESRHLAARLCGHHDQHPGGGGAAAMAHALDLHAGAEHRGVPGLRGHGEQHGPGDHVGDLQGATAGGERKGTSLLLGAGLWSYYRPRSW